MLLIKKDKETGVTKKKLCLSSLSSTLFIIIIIIIKVVSYLMGIVFLCSMHNNYCMKVLYGHYYYNIPYLVIITVF